MLNEVFFLTFEQIALFLVFFGVGLLLGRRKLLPDSTGTALSRLVMYIFLPAMNFLSFAQQFTVEKVGSYAVMLLAGTILLLLVVPLGVFAEKRFLGDADEKLAVYYSMIFTNFGYIGFPLVSALYGQAFLSQFMMFGLPFTVFAYAFALRKWMPAGQSQKKSDLLRQILNPSMIGILLGAAWGLLKLPLPELLINICQSASGCMSVCAMLLTGLAIGRISLAKAIREKRVYLVTAGRLLLLPALLSVLVFLICRLTGLDSSLLIMIGAFSALPLGMNPVIFSEMYGHNGLFAAECAFISLVCSLITLPLMFTAQNFLASLL